MLLEKHTLRWSKLWIAYVDLYQNESNYQLNCVVQSYKSKTFQSYRITFLKSFFYRPIENKDPPLNKDPPAKFRKIFGSE